MTRTPRSPLLLAAVLLAASATVLPAGAQRVGVSSAVNPDASAAAPGATSRRLVIGEDVVYNEHIATTASGQTQILFVDQSSISIGPNSDIVIDKFVYDPNAGTGTMAVSATQGVLRFIGGKLSKNPEGVTLHTPSATMGIHGGVFLLRLRPSGELEVVFLYGDSLIVTGLNGFSQTITRPGFAVTVARPGAAPSAPFPAPAGTTASLMTQLDGRSGGNGGARTIPTDATVASSGIAATISANIPASVQAATAQSQGQGQPAQTNVAAASANVNAGTVQAQGQPAIQNAVVNPPSQGSTIPNTTTTTTTTPPPTPPPPTPPPPPVVVTYAGHFKSTNGQGTANGFIDQSANGSAAYAGGTLTYPIGAPQNGVFTAALGSPGQVTIPLTPGVETFGPAGTTSPLGPVSGASYLSADGTFFFANLTPVNSPAEREFIFGGQPVSSAFYAPTTTNQITAFNVQSDAALVSSIPFITQSAGGDLGNASISPYYVVTVAGSPFGNFSLSTGLGQAPHTLQASLAITGQGASQSSVLTVQTGSFFTSTAGAVVGSGVVRGSYLASGTSPLVRIGSSVASVADGNGNNLFGGNSLTGFVLDQNEYNTTGNFAQETATQATLGGGTVSYAFNQPVIAGTVPAGVAAATRTTQTQTGYFGGIMGTLRGGSLGSPYVLSGMTTVQTNAATNRVAANFTGTDPFTPGTSGVGTVSLNFGSLTGVGFDRSAFINDSTFAALESPLTPSSVNGTDLPTTVGGATTPRIALVTSGTVPSTALLPAGVSFCACQFLQWGYWTADVPSGAGAGARTDEAHINTWIAGQPSVSLPTSGVGTFTGAAVGSVVNNGASYLAAGGFSNTYDFGARSGTLAITNFDGRNFGGTVTPTSGPNYTGGLAGIGGTANLSGTANGTFYGPLGAETGGNFAVQSTGGPSYVAAGIFAGKR